MYVWMDTYIRWSEGGKAQSPLSGIGFLARVPGLAPGQLGAVCVQCACGVWCHARDVGEAKL